MQENNVENSCLSNNEIKLIKAIAKAGLDIHLAIGLPSALEENEEYMEIMAEYINRKIAAGVDVTENDVVRASLILRGLIEVEEE